MSNLAFEIENEISTLTNNAAGHTIDNKPVFTAQLTGQTVVEAATDTLALDAATVANTEYYTVAANVITLVQAGVYTANIKINATNDAVAPADGDFTVTATLDGTIITGSTISAKGAAAATDEYSVFNSITFAAQAGDLFLIDLNSVSDDTTVTAVSSLNIIKIA